MNKYLKEMTLKQRLEGALSAYRGRSFQVRGQQVKGPEVGAWRVFKKYQMVFLGPRDSPSRRLTPGPLITGKLS